jgi:GntR family transcriptional regulator
MHRYGVIAEHLKRKILDGTYAPLTQLPSQRDLARSLGTTVVTVRQALDVLRDRGLLHAEHGLGTFVADVGRLDSFSEAMTAQNLSFETRLLSITQERGTSAVRRALELGDEEGVVAVSRLRLLAGVPVTLQRSHLSDRHAAALHGYDGTVPLYAQLRDRAFQLAVSYRETLSCRALSAADAAELDIAEGSLALESRRTSFTDSGTPLLYDEALLPSRRMSLTVTKQGRIYDVSFEPTASLADRA